MCTVTLSTRSAFVVSVTTSMQSSDDLEARYGLVVPSCELVRLLGYRTAGAFRQAARRECLGLPTFFITGRRGRYARTADVAKWIANQGISPKEEDVVT